jgi:protein O-GlcNAc transferase
MSTPASCLSLDPVQAALELHANGDIVSAIHAYQALLCKNPQNFPVLGPLATAIAQSGSPSDAILWFERARALRPDLAETLSENHATALLSVGGTLRVTEIARYSLALSPSTTPAYIHIAHAAFLQGQNQAAIRAGQRALHLDPRRTDLRVWVSDVLLGSDEIPGALLTIAKACMLDPTTGYQGSRLGKMYQKAKNLTPALVAQERAVRLTPDDDEAWSLLAEIRKTQQTFTLTESAYRSAIQLAPLSLRAILGLARVLAEIGEKDRAYDWVLRARYVQPQSQTLWSVQAKSLIDLGQYPAALETLKQWIILFPHQPIAYLQRAVVETLLHQPFEALQTLDRLEAMAPDLTQALLCRGDALLEIHRFEEALVAYQGAIDQGIGLCEAFMGVGNAAQHLGNYQQAISNFDQALRINPSKVEARLRRGNALLALNQFDRALQDFDQSLEEGATSAMLCINRGTALFQTGRMDEALHSYKTAIQLDPSIEGGFVGIAAVQQKRRQYREALRAHENAFRVSPQAAIHLASLIYCSTKCWGRQSLNEYLCEGLKHIEAGDDIGNPFPLLTTLDDALMLRKAAESHSSRFLDQKPRKAPRKVPASNPRRITIAYVSSDLDTSHPVGTNLKPLLESHDRQHFKLIGFNLSENRDANLLPYFDEVQQGHGRTDSEMAAWARAQHVDIAIDLNGYTEGSRVGLFAERAAPVQINYLGYPGTMGTPFHDFIVADDYVIPSGQGGGFSEHVLRLPHFLMPYNFHLQEERSPSWMSREAFGLPQDAFVYCSFNDFHKISEKMLSTWIAILRKSRNTVLWLAIRGDVAEQEIRAHFERSGIAHERLIVARRVDSHSQHLARLMLADLMLDTFPYNSHTTACDAVKSGLPVLSLCGRTFQSRVCASLLNQMGCRYLVTSSFEEYTGRAIELAGNQDLWSTVRKAFQEGRARLPTPTQYARSLERLYTSTLS